MRVISMPDRDEIQRIAAAMNALRPDWPVRSLVTLLERHATRSYRDLAVAGVVVATDPQTQTPRLLDQAGAWWRAAQVATGTATTGAVPLPTDARCGAYGHAHQKLPCAACRSEEIAARDDELDALAVAAPTARDVEHAARIRKHLPPTTRQPDVRALAAGEREDDR